VMVLVRVVPGHCMCCTALAFGFVEEAMGYG